MTLMSALKSTGLLARKGEAAPSLERASFNDPSLAWGNEAPVPPPTLVWPRMARRSAPAAVLSDREAERGAASPRLPGPRQAFTARLPVSLHQRLKTASARTGRPMTHLVAEALERWMGGP